MYAMRRRMAAGLAVLLAAGGCTRGEQDHPDGEPANTRVRQTAAAQPPPPPPMTAADSARERARIAALADSVRAAFGRASGLSAREVAELRQDRNAEQVATARSLGVRASGEAQIQQLLREGRLVPLEDSTAYWVLREMEHSVPYVIPDTRKMLEEIGRRFHQRLDSLGLPRYRIKITSALRTDETQADLRKTNSYAARTTSAHEFGTTVDVSHERFAVPAAVGARGGTWPAARQWETEVLDEVGEEHSRVLQAELGRAIAEMRDLGALHVMMENRQPVYHTTVARPVAAADARRAQRPASR
jgi:hypothetical protein